MRETDHGSRKSDEGYRFISARLPTGSRGRLAAGHTDASWSDWFRGDFAQGQGRERANHRISRYLGGHFHSGMSASRVNIRLIRCKIQTRAFGTAANEPNVYP